MSLTAITGTLDLFNPSALIKSGKNKDTVVKEMRDLQRFGLYCPHCYFITHELHRVNFRNAETRRPHFFHLNSGNDSQGCANYRGETDKHLDAKAYLGEWLRSLGKFASVTIDSLFVESEDGQKRKPDILAEYPNGAREAYEIQISPINSGELAIRTNDLKAGGCQSVIWYLYGSNYNPENREWCFRNGVIFYRIQFTADGQPSWTQGTRPDGKSRTEDWGHGKDRCDRKDRAALIEERAAREAEFNRRQVERIPFPEIGSRCKHRSPHASQHGWHGTVIGHPMPNMLEIEWDEYPIGKPLEKKHPYKDQSYTRFPSPDRLPISLLQEIED